MMTWLSWFPDTAWKGAALLATAWIASRLLRKQPAALRHLVWTVTLGALLVMPALSATTPLQLPLLASIATAAPAVTRTHDDNGARSPAAGVALGPPLEIARDTPLSVSAADASRPLALSALSLVQWLAVVWIIGVIALAARFIVSLFATIRLRRTSIQPDQRLLAALRHSSARAGLRTTPGLLVTDAVGIPCAFGWVRPTVVLPLAAREWTDDRLEVVLLHESTHIRRGDYVTHLIAEIARIVHWYNPLVWVASRSLRAEAERATDEGVINAGATASDYAAHLLDIVRGAGVRRVPAPLLPLAMRSEFEGRLISILEYAGSRHLRARTVALTVLIGAALATTVASIGAAAPAVPGSSEATGSDPDTPALPAPTRSAVTPSMPPAQFGQSVTESIATIRALIDAIRDSVPAVRLAVVNALSDTRDTIVVRELMRVLRDDESAEVRRAAAHSLGEIEDVLALPALADALLRDRDAEVRRYAASALGSLESEQGAGALAQALDADADMEVRINAAQALGGITGSTAGTALARALSRASEPKLKVAVIEALDGHDDTRAVPALTAALRDSDAAVRAAAAHALDGIDDTSIMPALISAARDEDVEVRRAVIDALNHFEDRRLVDVFATALADRDAEIRGAAASGLGNIEGLRTAPRQLIAALDDADPDVRQEAANALGNIEDPASLNALIARASDPIADVRLAVVEAIGEFTDASATAALQKALRDSDADVRAAAAEGLGDRRRK